MVVGIAFEMTVRAGHIAIETKPVVEAVIKELFAKEVHGVKGFGFYGLGTGDFDEITLMVAYVEEYELA